PTPVVDPDPPPAAESDDEPATEDLWFQGAQGTRLHAWLAPFRGAQAALIFCHGNRGNVFMPYSRDTLRTLRRATRAHVLFWDYRGYGRSEGQPTEELVSLDARAALVALERATGVPPGRTIAIGQSLGGAVAIDLAWRTPDLAGLVVVSSFT